MPVSDAEFFPLIVTGRNGSLYQQPPSGTDMGAARLRPIADVRAGDWVLGSHERALDPDRLDTLMQSIACYPALPAALNGYVALDGQTPWWRDTETVLVIPREYMPASTYAARSGGYRVGDRVERSCIYTPVHDDPRDKVGQARPVIERGTVIDAADDKFTVAWAGRWVNGRSKETAMRLADPAAVEQERATFGFAVGDTVTTDGSCATGVVLELYFHWYTGVPMARVYWPNSGWDNYCRYDFAPTHRYSHKIPDDAYRVTSRESYPAAPATA
ncbi:hypothetical protein [Streptomyces sp. NPDC050428]|uniref:hypothetical protein n=1 Tax=Streptomyces sp. NPDC050428 TaxID=3155757 RepID=UPI00343A1B72